MTSIGLRVYSNKKIYYCIIEKDIADNSYNYLDISTINIPQSLSWPEALHFTRNTILDILNLYSIKRAIIRICEFGVAHNTTIIERCYIEGMLQESIASSPVEKFLAGQISEFASLLNFERKDFKKLATAELVFDNIPKEMDWSNLGLEKREVILVANAAFNL